MKVNKIVFEFEDGSSHYITSEKDIMRILPLIPRDVELKKTATIDILHKKYFAMLETLRKNTDLEKSYSKSDFPNTMKPILFSNLMDRKEFFINNIPEQSTKALS